MSIAESARIHPTAIVEEGASIGAAVIGPYCCVGADVTLADGVVLGSHVVVDGITTIGAETRIYPFAAIGTAPQDLKYHGEPTRLEIGARNTIREHVTMHTGTEGGGGITSIGDNCLFMIGTHIAHDCRIGSGAILANNATVAGHVEIGDFTVVGGLSAIHQFARIGAHAMIGGMSGVERDVIPFGTVMGNRAALAGLNIVGMKRRGFDRESIHSLRAAYRTLFEDSEGTLDTRAKALSEQAGESGPVRDVVDFILAGGSRHFCVPA